MKNSDMPAMPLGPKFGLNEMPYQGLTKREHFAGLAMQGILASHATYEGETTNRKLLAIDALAHADALLAELDK